MKDSIKVYLDFPPPAPSMHVVIYKMMFRLENEVVGKVVGKVGVPPKCTQALHYISGIHLKGILSYDNFTALELWATR